MFIIIIILLVSRPFISSLAFPSFDFIHSALFIVFLSAGINFRGTCFKRIQGLKYPLLIFSLALVLSTIFSIDKIVSLRELYKYVTAILLFLFASSLSYSESLRLIRVIVFTGFIISLLAVYQYFFGFQHILNYINRERISDPFILDYLSRKRVYFPFVTPNTLAGYLIMIIPLALSDKKNTWVILPLFLALFFTESIGAILSISLVLIPYFYFQAKTEKINRVLLIELLLFAGLIIFARGCIQKPNHTLPLFSTVTRLNYWKGALEIARSFVLTGMGPGNFNLLQTRYAHNTYLQICAETGILGLFSFLWFVVLTFRYAVKNLKTAENKNYISAGVILASAAFIIHNFIDFTFFLPEVAFIWWVIFGLNYSNQKI